ncbi:MAG: Holliday junction resolvase RuvX [Candidatus Marinimicrobia bacterium]|nr:Holliday junction resolvase RuvX [Candidatus Neomarinimicrobiota bacterium]
MSNSGRILSIDYGEKRVGLAITDPLAITSRGFQTLINKDRAGLLKTLIEIINSNEIKKIVIGIPYSLDDSIGPMAVRVRKFGEELSTKTDVEIEEWPEEFSTEDAKTELRKLNVEFRKDKGKVDMMAAALILRSYLNAQPLTKSP